MSAGTERIQKVLANAGVASRRACEELVLAGRVQVNGVVIRRLPVLIDPKIDKLKVDGQTVRTKPPAGRKGRPGAYVYIILNKPAGVVCTNRAQHTSGQRQKRAVDLLPPDFQRRVYPVGRLDSGSRGLLLLTDDGELTHKLTHPSFGVPKTYRVVCVGEVTNEILDKLREGIFLVDRDTGQGNKTKPAHFRVARRSPDETVLEVTIKEGRNRQIRRMLAASGHKVRDLKRVRFGPLKLAQLPESASRLLTWREVADLRQAVGAETR